MISSSDGLDWPDEITKLEFYEMGRTSPLVNETETETGNSGAMLQAKDSLTIFSNFPRNYSIAVLKSAR